MRAKVKVVNLSPLVVNFSGRLVEGFQESPTVECRFRRADLRWLSRLRSVCIFWRVGGALRVFWKLIVCLVDARYILGAIVMLVGVVLPIAFGFFRTRKSASSSAYVKQT
jgi:hypothetical protein